MRTILALLLFPVWAQAQFENPAFVGSATIPVSAAPPAGEWAPTNYFGWYVTPTNVSNGTLVTSVANQSGAGRNLYVFNASTDYSPYVTNNVWNGHPAMRFGAGVSRCLTNAFTELSQPFTVFMVCALAATGDYMPADGIDSTHRTYFLNNQTAGNMTLYAGTAQTGGSPLIASSGLVLTIYFNGASSYLRTNGASAFSVAGSIGTQTLLGFTIGARYSGTLYNVNGWIAEVVIYNATLADGDRNWVEQNLKTKYGF